MLSKCFEALQDDYNVYWKRYQRDSAGFLFQPHARDARLELSAYIRNRLMVPRN